MISAGILQFQRGTDKRLKFGGLVLDAGKTTFLRIVTGLAGTVRISLYQRGEDAVIFSVENPVDDSFRPHLKRMFERFYTGDPVRKDQGAGLRLEVARILAERLGGKINADIQSGRFTVFVELNKEGK